MANPVLSHRLMAQMTVHCFSELDLRMFLGECTGPTVWSTATLQRFVVLMALMRSPWALSDPALTRIHLVILPSHVLKLLHQCQIEHFTGPWATSHPTFFFRFGGITPCRIALQDSYVRSDDGALLTLRRGELRQTHLCCRAVLNLFSSNFFTVTGVQCADQLIHGNLLVRLNSFSRPPRSVHRTNAPGILVSDESSSTRVISLIESVSCTWSKTNIPLCLRGGDICASCVH